jgi:hypothetical protein
VPVVRRLIWVKGVRIQDENGAQAPCRSACPASTEMTGSAAGRRSGEIGGGELKLAEKGARQV